MDDRRHDAPEPSDADAPTWRRRGLALERSGHAAGAFEAFGRAYAADPNGEHALEDLARAAIRIGRPDFAESLLIQRLAERPGSLEALNNLACAQREALRFGEAVETLRSAITAHPEDARLWNTLGTVLICEDRMREALPFLDEAIRIDSAFADALHNRAIARLGLEDAHGALADIDAALRVAAQAGDLQVARAKILLACGDLAAGWSAYEARFAPDYEDALVIEAPGRRWTGEPVRGRRMLVVGEQGLGDEVLFANVIPDLLEDLGPEGRLSIACAPRLQSLFARSFPAAHVAAHETGLRDGRPVRTPGASPAAQDFHAPAASLLRAYRSSLAAFPSRAYLSPDPARVAAWRRELAALPGPRIGILWKSLVHDAARLRYFAPFSAWRPALETPGASFVLLQYGDVDAEMAAAETWGARIWRPPGLDLLNDLEGVVALCCALDLTIGPANASTNLAGAAGAPLWLVSTPGAWPRLGAQAYPWYPQARVFTPAQPGGWPEIFTEIAGALRVKSAAG